MIWAHVFSLHVSLHCLHKLFLQCDFWESSVVLSHNRFLFSVDTLRYPDTLCVQSTMPSSCTNSSWGSFVSALPESTGILALLHAFQGNIDDGNQTLRGAQRAEQPVWIRLAKDPQDVTLSEAELTGRGGYVVAQCSYFTEEPQRTQKGQQSSIQLKEQDAVRPIGLPWPGFNLLGWSWCFLDMRGCGLWLCLLPTPCTNRLSHKVKNGPIQREPTWWWPEKERHNMSWVFFTIERSKPHFEETDSLVKAEVSY